MHVGCSYWERDPLAPQALPAIPCKGSKAEDTCGTKGAGFFTPPPPCESNTKAPKFDGNNTYRSSDKGAYL